ncbi:LCP family protein [Mammaliicoccus sciuri]|uniref:Regulatory protein MsrR n=1 Tax=Sporosarcina newyorkensis TaxID=759851 RepID=A0A1T4XPG5_9BACL|nr:LCP family protein [Sporosarcina newyorkensis]SKA91021.1 transcriptional attenuator, LytR family [Sporosarcina newyorkensis]
METRSKRRRKKSKGRRNFFLIFAFILLAGAIYFVNQYTSGVSLANGDTTSNVHTELNSNSSGNGDLNTKFEPFEGADPQFGEINVLLIGNDARADEEDARSDALMIGHYDQHTNKVKLVSLMRDTYVEVPEYGMQKINAAFFLGGPELVRKTIKQNFDIDVQYYAIVDFEGFTKIVDVIAPDGIHVDIPYPMSHGIGMTLEPGEQHLNGEQLLAYVRFRHDIHSDFGRVERQQEALSKLKEQAISVHTLLNLPKLLGVVDSYLNTNIDSKILFAIGKGMVTGGKSKEMETLRIPVEGSYTDKRVNVGAVLDINLEENKEILKDFLASNKNDEE